MERVWRKGKSPTLLVGIYIGIATVWRYLRKLKTELRCVIIQIIQITA